MKRGDRRRRPHGRRRRHGRPRRSPTPPTRPRRSRTARAAAARTSPRGWSSRACRRCSWRAWARTPPGAGGDRGAARARGVELEVAIDALHATGTCVVIVEPGGERTMLPDRGANAALEPSRPPDRRVRRGRPPAPVRLHAARPRLAAGRPGRARARARGGHDDLGRPGVGGAAAGGRRPQLPGLDAAREPAAPQRRGGGGADRRARPRGRRLGARQATAARS